MAADPISCNMAELVQHDGQYQCGTVERPPEDTGSDDSEQAHAHCLRVKADDFQSSVTGK